MGGFPPFVKDRQDEDQALGVERTDSGARSPDLGVKEHEMQLASSLIGENTCE